MKTLRRSLFLEYKDNNLWQKSVLFFLSTPRESRAMFFFHIFLVK